jgi:type IV pilus assembly protein PilM
MALLPTTLGTRPRLAVEIRPEGVIAARSEDAQAVVSAVAHGVLTDGVIVPALKAGNVGNGPLAVAAVKKALEAVALKERQTTLVVPDAAVRVLLLEFDQLPAKAAEAIPVVRFRLKKLLPFDADEAAISYQVMSQTRGMVRVLAVAIPRDVLAEYEAVVREAGFEPGAVLPSTLAACAGMVEADAATLLVNATDRSVTTAIVQGGVLLLHRTVDLQAEGLHERMMLAALANPTVPEAVLPLVDADASAGEWARQEPVNGYGVLDDQHIADKLAEDIQREIAEEFAAARVADPSLELEVELEAQKLTAVEREVTQAVSVAAAYFEDTLASVPGVVVSAGTMGADMLGKLLREAGFGDGEIRVREMVEPAMLMGGAVSARVPYGWMAGVRGALRS